MSSRFPPALIIALCGLALSAGALGCERDTSPERPGLATTRPASAPVVSAFSDRAAESGLIFRWSHGGKTPLDILETLGHGCAFLDYDQDGWLDALLVGNEGCALFRNLGDGKFEDVSSASGVPATGRFFGVAVGDYDNDGFPDFYLFGYGVCALYQNRNGKFVDVTAKSGLKARGPYDVVTACAFADLDNDGRLDLFAGRYIRFTPQSIRFCTYGGVTAGCGVKNYDPDQNRVYRNLGNGVFRDVTNAWGFDATHGRCLGVALCAGDGQGVKLYAANDELPGDLMTPRGKRFVNEGVSSGTAYNRQGLTQGGMGVDWGDYNNDGRPDLVVATFQSEAKSFYREDGDGIFLEVSGPVGLAAETTRYVAWTAKLFDQDNDGWLDLLFTNGHSQDNAAQVEAGRTYAQPTQLFRNDGKGGFRQVSEPLLARPIVGRGAAFGDYDNDGALDVVAVNEEGSVQLLHNETNAGGHWLGLRLRGARSNRDGIGARVVVKAGEKTWVRDHQLAGGYLSAHDPRLHIGLGAAATVDSVSVTWPDGRVDTLRGVPIDRYHLLVQGRGIAPAADP